MTKAASAYANMVAHKMNCAQCVFTAFTADLGLEPEVALKIAMGFGGGMGRTGQTCGAVTGAYMALGLKQNLTPKNADQIKEKTYALMAEFNRKFRKLHGSTICKELLGCDLGTPEGLAKVHEKSLFTTLCPKLVRDAVKIVEKLGK
jgi:C_GCAxxG_C_C family probable redox protein